MTSGSFWCEGDAGSELLLGMGSATSVVDAAAAAADLPPPPLLLLLVDLLLGQKGREPEQQCALLTKAATCNRALGCERSRMRARFVAMSYVDVRWMDVAIVLMPAVGSIKYPFHK
jgi:hypothetical protein